MSADRCDSASQPVRWIGHPVQNITGVISASWTQWFSSTGGTHAPNTSWAIAAYSTGSVSTAPASTRRARPAISAARSAASESCLSDAGTTWHGRGPGLPAVRRVAGGSAARGGLDDQRAVDHVHPAREPELPRLARIKPHGGPLPGRQRGAHPEIGEHHPGGAVTGFLPVEGQLDGHPLAHPDHLGTVPAPDRDLQ